MDGAPAIRARRGAHAVPWQGLPGEGQVPAGRHTKVGQGPGAGLGRARGRPRVAQARCRPSAGWWAACRGLAWRARHARTALEALMTQPSSPHPSHSPPACLLARSLAHARTHAHTHSLSLFPRTPPPLCSADLRHVCGMNCDVCRQFRESSSTTQDTDFMAHATSALQKVRRAAAAGTREEAGWCGRLCRSLLV